MPDIRRAAVVLAVAALCACRPEGREVRIGFGYPWHRAGVLAQELADSMRTPDGRPIRIEMDSVLVDRTTGYQAFELGQAARLSSRADIAGVVSRSGSREALLTAPIYNEAGVPQLLAGATSRRLRGAGQWTFMLAPPDAFEGDFIGRFAAEQLRAGSALVFYVVDEYGTGLRDGVLDALARHGLQVTQSVPLGTLGTCGAPGADAEFEPAVDAALLHGRPDVTILAARTTQSACVIARIRHRFPGMRFVAGDGVTLDTTFVRQAGGPDSIYVVAFWHHDRPDSLSRAFVQRFQRHWPGVTPNQFDAVYFDALMTLVTAVRTVGGGREQVRGYLASLGRGRPPLPGVAGPIEFPATADRLVMTRRGAADLELVRWP